MFSCCVTADGGSLICVDSDQTDASGSVESVNLTTLMSTPLCALPRDLIRPTAATFGSKVFLTGGKTYEEDDDRYSPSDSVFTLVGNGVAAWATHPSTLKTARLNHASVAFDGSLWVAGGARSDMPAFLGGSGPLASVEVFDEVTGAWRHAGRMTKVKRSHEEKTRIRKLSPHICLSLSLSLSLLAGPGQFPPRRLRRQAVRGGG